MCMIYITVRSFIFFVKYIYNHFEHIMSRKRDRTSYEKKTIHSWDKFQYDLLEGRSEPKDRIIYRAFFILHKLYSENDHRMTITNDPTMIVDKMYGYYKVSLKNIDDEILQNMYNPFEAQLYTLLGQITILNQMSAYSSNALKATEKSSIVFVDVMTSDTDVFLYYNIKKI